ncbi:MAG: RdgB/HAM1 family non-canonical purine NTP pyrophosphatase [Clostridia bacterium]|nr:RdgB/HAM1 family non-canonical purine NTP pyrophosphatase [Clostridia bacterium]
MQKKKLVLASGNLGKIREIEVMFPEFEVIGYKQLGITEEIDENGETFYENALIKAKTVSEKLNLPVIADDSGLCVDALNGAPGIYSARYAGDGDDEHNNQLLLENLKNVTDRKARFVCCMVYFYKGKILTATENTEGEILFEKQGENGFGYDPLFYSYDLQKCFGVASVEEKNKVSHRFRAVSKLKELLKKENIL